MKLISPKHMGEKEKKSLRLCLKNARLDVERGNLIASIAEGMAGIEEGVRIIDQDVPFPRLGVVDLVAEDVRGRLVLINFAVKLDAEVLGRALVRADWAVDNLEFLGHVYSRSFPQDVRCWQMVGSVTNEACSLLSRMDVAPAEVFTCEGVDLGSEKWLVVRRYDAEDALRESFSQVFGNIGQTVVAKAPSVMRDPNAAKGGEAEQFHSVLTREEIDDFFDASGYEQEVTSRVSNPSSS
jgi:hypothetical protein